MASRKSFSAPSAAVFGKGAESNFFARAVGRVVTLRLREGVKSTVKLLWVDMYTIGILDDQGQEVLLYKSAVASITL